MKKITAAIAAIMIGFSGATIAATDDTPAPIIKRVSIFSTTTDWQALTGLQLNEYRGKFIPNAKLIGSRGLVLYYLDAFPCYGLGDGVRVWLGPKNQHSGQLRIACIAAPTQIQFAWRNATRDADDAVSEGMLTCPVTGDRELTIDLGKCTRGPEWSNYK